MTDTATTDTAKLVSISIQIPRRLRNQFKSICVENELTMAEALIPKIEDFVSELGGRRKTA